MIDNSWGGSSCEAWIRRDRMEGNPSYDGLLKKWDDSMKGFDPVKWQKLTDEWREKAEIAEGGAADSQTATQRYGPWPEPAGEFVSCAR